MIRMPSIDSKTHYDLDTENELPIQHAARTRMIRIPTTNKQEFQRRDLDVPPPSTRPGDEGVTLSWEPCHKVLPCSSRPC